MSGASSLSARTKPERKPPAA
jgi:hypothetical protein